METAKTLKMMISFKSWIMILLLSALLHSFGVDGCGFLDPLSILKTIENDEDGETIHCVDIYKQPAFNHPQLRNHTIQMKPSSNPFEHKSKSSSYSKNSSGLYLQNWHKRREFCPEGTIPILQSSREDFPQRTTHPLDFDGQKPRGGEKEYATAFLPELDVHGASADISLWNPIVWPREYSTAQITLTDTTVENLKNTIEAGWLVNPDHQVPQLFIYWTTDGYGTTGCYNLCCSGFVQTSKLVVLGGKILPYSTYRGKQQYITISINRDDSTGNWWLTFMHEVVGYWPANIFTGGLRTCANLVGWGGEVLNSNTGRHTSTQMGSGHYPSEGWKQAAYFKDLAYLTSGGEVKSADKIQPRANRPECYALEIRNLETTWGVYFYYGGPGASVYCK